MFESISDSGIWEFLAEGKMHVVVSSSFGFFRTMILRIPKKTVKSDNTDKYFIEHLMLPWFTQSSLSQSTVVELSSAFISSLIAKINTARPTSRRASLNILELAHHGYLEFNYNHVHKDFPRELSGSVSTDEGGHDYYGKHSLSFDLKVKCGLISTSAFVNYERELKLKHSKFHLMQLYKLAKKTKATEPAWGVFHTVSQYNPCDLCSMNKTKVCSALTALVDCPQNNLRVCHDGHHVFGWDMDSTEGDVEKVCRQFLEMEGIVTYGSKASLSRIQDLMSTILCAENSLRRLEQMQSLDLLDVEGAATVFRRLVDLSEGDQIEAETVLTKSFLTPIDEQVLRSITHCVSGFSEYDDSLCPPVVVSLTALRITNTTPRDVAEHHRLSAHSLVTTMTVSDCLLLLTLWMMALVAKDASVIVSLVRVVGCDVALDYGADVQLIGNHSVLRQTASTAGLIGVTESSKDPCCGTPSSRDVFAYCLSLVDVGLKSPHKVWTKSDEEQELYDMYVRGAELNER